MLFRTVCFVVPLMVSVSMLHGQADLRSMNREFARIRADMKVLQEDQIHLLNRINGLVQENVAKEAQITELQKLLAALEARIQGVEAELKTRCDQLQAAMESEKGVRRKELDTAITAMSVEISKLDKVAAAAAAAAAADQTARARPAYTGKYVEIEVLKGDTLSAIAVKAGVPVSTLQQLNGLKDDTIRIGQKLKVPVAQ
ncbi:MAG: LysM peptidoglycan-binding domain-containing protein [Lentisphaerae bacterium]|nr:LysM peptidoglycan-binding domain-containing protein [Lentisphaerota bacterium]